MNNGGHIATRQIEKAWRLGGRELIPEFLESKGINPVSQIPFGRGTLRLYESSVLDLRSEFERFLAKKNSPGGNKDIRTNIRAKNLRIEERLQTIEQKLDVIISMFKE